MQQNEIQVNPEKTKKAQKKYQALDNEYTRVRLSPFRTKKDRPESKRYIATPNIVYPRDSKVFRAPKRSFLDSVFKNPFTVTATALVLGLVVGLVVFAIGGVW